MVPSRGGYKMSVKIVSIQPPIAPDRVESSDVTVIFERDGEIVNGTGNVLNGVTSELGRGVLGFMELGR